MKKIIILSILALASALGASAQYYEMSNQLEHMLGYVFSGSWQYKGFVDASGFTGLGDNKATIASITTTQGLQRASWFFMGVGMGVDILRTDNKEIVDGSDINNLRDYNETGVMIPLFTDFRFTLGSSDSQTKVFIDLRLGASFLIGKDYLSFDGGNLSNNGQFYLRPSLGLRFPTNKANSKQAISVGAAYQLLTSNNNRNWNGGSALTLHALGLTVAYEW